MWFVVDSDMMSKLATAPFVLVVEGRNVKTGLGSRFGSYLLEAGFARRYRHLGTNREAIEALASARQRLGRTVNRSETPFVANPAAV